MNFVRLGPFIINLNQVAYIHTERCEVIFASMENELYMCLYLDEEDMEQLIELIQKLPMRTTMV